MTEDKAPYVMSDERLAALERIMADEVPISYLSTARELAIEVRRLRQRERQLLIILAWAKGRASYRGAALALGIGSEFSEIMSKQGRFLDMIGEAIGEGERIIEEAQGEVV